MKQKIILVGLLFLITSILLIDGNQASKVEGGIL